MRCLFLFFFILSASLKKLNAQTTSKGGVTVANLRIASVEGEPTAISFGSKESSFKMGVEQDDFVVSGPHETVFTVTADDKLRISSVFAVNSLEINGHLMSGEVRQFLMVVQEDYSSGSAEGWDNRAAKDIVSSCAGITMLGGYGKFAKGEVTKNFQNLPPHSELRVEAVFHFLDAWIGETGFMRMNIGTDGSMVYVWTDRHSQVLDQNAVNVCGGKVSEGKFAVPLSVTVQHNANNVVIGFGSTLQSDDPYDQSWGVSGISIYVR